jgi:hypothetical protein
VLISVKTGEAEANGDFFATVWNSDWRHAVRKHSWTEIRETELRLHTPQGKSFICTTPSFQGAGLLAPFFIERNPQAAHGPPSLAQGFLPCAQTAIRSLPA